MAAGTYNLPFKFEIPGDAKLPPSFESGDGHIRYFLTSKICRPGIKLNDKKKVPINIVPRIDVNEAEYNEPVKIDDTKTLCCCCCADGPIKVDFEAPRKAYTPGDHVDIKVSIDNKSSKVLPGFSIVIREKTSLYTGMAKFYSVHTSKIIDVAVFKEDISPNSEFSKTVSVVIPQAGPTFDLDVGKAIRNLFLIGVAVKIHGFHSSICALSPVVLGTVPYNGPSSSSSSSSSSGNPGDAKVNQEEEGKKESAEPPVMEDKKDDGKDEKDESVANGEWTGTYGY